MVAMAGARWVRNASYGLALSLNRRHFSPEDTLFITGIERSGTTWLAELLSALPGRCLIFQPVQEWYRRGQLERHEYRSYRDPSSPWPKGEALFGGLFCGEQVPPHSLTHDTLRTIATASSLVIKSVQSNPILPWISRNVPGPGMLVIARHPCAVVASLTRHGTASAERIVPADQRYVDEQLPHLRSFVAGLATSEERLAVRWCCEHHPLFRHADEGSWQHVDYEKLILEGPDELQRICEPLGLDFGERSESLMARNSLMVGPWSVDHSKASPEARLSAWKRHLTEEQSARVIGVLEAFGIKGYSSEAVPDFDNIGLAG